MIVRSGCPVRRLSSTAMVALSEGAQDLGSSMIVRSGCPVRSDSTAMAALLAEPIPDAARLGSVCNRAFALARRVRMMGGAVVRLRAKAMACML